MINDTYYAINTDVLILTPYTLKKRYRHKEKLEHIHLEDFDFKTKFVVNSYLFQFDFIIYEPSMNSEYIKILKGLDNPVIKKREKLKNELFEINNIILNSNECKQFWLNKIIEKL